MRTYRETSFRCGTCRKPLLFMVRTSPPGAWYVHPDRRFRCRGRRWRGPDTNSLDLLLPSNVEADPQ